MARLDKVSYFSLLDRLDRCYMKPSEHLAGLGHKIYNIFMKFKVVYYCNIMSYEHHSFTMIK